VVVRNVAHHCCLAIAMLLLYRIAEQLFGKSPKEILFLIPFIHNKAGFEGSTATSFAR